MSGSDSSSALLETLRRKFLSRLAQRAAEFDQALGLAAQGEAQPALATIGRLAHSLKGAARQFECPELAGPAEYLEKKAAEYAQQSQAILALPEEIVQKTHLLAAACRQLSDC